MARFALTDHLQTHPFWIMDAGPLELGALPVLNPLSGFSAVTAPEVTIQLKDIKEGNQPLTKKVVQSGEVGNITLSRGVTFSNSDFWRWTVAALTGNTSWEALFGRISTKVGGKTYRRDLLLVQFFARSPIGPASAILEAGNDILSGAAAATNGLAPFDIALRVPAKAWLLKGCVPLRYKTGGDFDAKSAEVSIAEIEIAIESIEEISLAAI